MNTKDSPRQATSESGSVGSVEGFIPPTHADGARIIRLQDDQESLDLLAARFDRYGRAAWLLGAQFGIMLGTVGLAVSRLFFGPTWDRTADVLILISLFAELLLDELQATAREQGAAVQETFDRRLYQLSWPTGWIDRPDPEMIALWSNAARRRATEVEQARWRGWYPAAVAQLPLPVARLACQRANAWWDADQRGTYARFLLGSGAVSLTIILTVAIIPDLSREMVGNGVMVWIPIPYWLMREGLRHRKAAVERRCVLQRAQAGIEGASAAPSDNDAATRRAEEIQTALFAQRREGPLVWSWFYCHRRPTREAAMIIGTEDVLARWRALRG